MSVGPDDVARRPLRRARSAPNLTKRGQKSARKPDGLHFRVEFHSPSLGTEQELAGVIVKRRKDAGRKIGEVVKNGEVLLLITTDMVHREVGDYQFCTLEIITTPTEGADGVGWADRTEAFTVLIAEIEEVARRNGGAGGVLRSELLGIRSPYLMLICTPDHQISMENPQSNVVVTSTDRQGTLGVPTSGMLKPFTAPNQPAPVGPNPRIVGNLQPPAPEFQVSSGIPKPDWYDDAAAAWAATQWPLLAMQQVYALIESAIQKFVLLMGQDQKVVDALWTAELSAEKVVEQRAAFLEVIASTADEKTTEIAYQKFVLAELTAKLAQVEAQQAVNHLLAMPDWKNAWKPLPRTPLITLLDQLADVDAETVLASLNGFTMQEQDMLVVNWAKSHILSGYRLGGHDIDAPTIAGRRGFLLEYRGVQPEYFKDKFYYATGEAGIYTAAEPPRIRRAKAEAWQKRRRNST